MLAVAVMPRWVTDEHAITLATWALVFVTFLLVIATVVLWYDSWKKGKEQRERWKREDEQHAQGREEERARWKRADDLRNSENKIHYRFGVKADKDGGVAVWVANMGTTTILWKSLWIERGVPITYEKLDIRPLWIEQMLIVSAGDLVEYLIPNDFYLSRPDLNLNGRGTFSMGVRYWLGLTGTSDQEITAKKRFDVLVDPDVGLVATSRGFGHDGIEA